MSLKRILLLTGFLFVAGVSHLQAGAITWATNPGGSDYEWDGETVGTQFRTTSAIAVCALGIWDQNSDGLSNSYDVYLWDMSANLLAQATVASGTAARLQDGSRWADLVTPVQLAGNTSYVVAAYRPNSADLFPWVFANEVTLSTGIAEDDRWNGGVSFPFFSEYKDAVIGANFQYVPEPSSCVLCTFGVVLAGIGQLRRRLAAKA